MTVNLNRPPIVIGQISAEDVTKARQHSTGNVWQMPRRASACTGDCRQGRDCTCAPDTVPVQPAEACTELGADAAESMWRHRRTEAAVRWGLSLVAVLAVVGYVVRTVWLLA